MAKIKIEVEVSKETHDVGVAVASLVTGLIEKKPLTDLVVRELTHLKDAVDNVTAVPGELSEDPGAFARAIANPLADVLTAVAKKPAQATA